MDASKTATGLQNTARIAFCKYAGTSEVDASQTDILKETAGTGVGAPTAYISDVAIWEPNADDHVDYIVKNNNKITWSASDASAYATKTLDDGTKGFDTTTKMPTYALKTSAVGQTINDIYMWNGTEANLARQYTLQTTKTSTTDYTIKEGVQNLVKATDGTTAFGIAPNKITRIRVYLWLEGQDVDCINYASHGGGVKVNIGLVKGSVVGSTEAPGN